MKETFGIISGAGPMAGISLLKQVIRGCQEKGAWKDSDFPEIRLINYPFAEMLAPEFDATLVRAQLDDVISELQRTCQHIVIACNTLHLFLPKRKIPELINLMDMMKHAFKNGDRPLVLSSRTSARQHLHEKLLGVACDYWHPEESQKMIDTILAGKSIDLSWFFDLSHSRTVILGCTEYSLATAEMTLPERMIDPLKLAATHMIDLASRSIFAPTLS